MSEAKHWFFRLGTQYYVAGRFAFGRDNAKRLLESILREALTPLRVNALETA
jgi:hypothetical protein